MKPNNPVSGKNLSCKMEKVTLISPIGKAINLRQLLFFIIY
jgi:hypothetical protein